MCATLIEIPENATTATRGNTEAVIKKLVPKQVIPNLMDLARSAELKRLRHKGGIKNGY